MSEVTKHGSIVGHGVIPGPIVPPTPDRIGRLRELELGSTAFDGDDFDAFNPSFDIDGAAARIVTKYDRDDDGAIDLGTGGLGDMLRRETSLLTRSGTTSIADLAKFADQHGDGDGSATVEEISDVIAKFDQGIEGDGRLSGQERETFLEVFGEQRSPYVRHRIRRYDPMPSPIPRPFQPGIEAFGPDPIGFRAP